MKKYLVRGCAVLFLVFTALEQVWAGGYVVVVPREPVVIYTPGATTTAIVVEEPAVVMPCDRYYDTRYYRGYATHRYPPKLHVHHGPPPSRSVPCVSPGRSWGFSAGIGIRR
jgi:hypothetical protein